MHPALNTLAPQHRLLAEQAVYRRYGNIMSVPVAATLAAAGPVLARTPDHRSTAYRETLASAICYAVMLVITLTQNVPINRRLLALEDSPDSYAALAELRARWDRLHTVRNVLNLGGLALAAMSALSSGVFAATANSPRPRTTST